MVAPGLRYRNPMWNGEEVKATHELMGRVESRAGDFYITEPDEELIEESRKISGVDPEKVFVVFGEEEVTEGIFEIDVFADPGREITIGVYSSRLPKQVYVSDETNPPRDWNGENVNPFLWRIKDGISTFEEKAFPHYIQLSACAKAELKIGEFNQFRYEADGKRMLLYLNGKLLHEASVPAFKALTSIVSDTDSEIIIKVVYMSEEDDEIEILLDCDVEDDYEAYVVSGEKTAENSFERPQNVCDVIHRLTGSARKFAYKAPALSANVIRLKKRT